ncbi:hypothetical protein AB0K16_20060 [Nonomuraea jabiensis]
MRHFSPVSPLPVRKRSTVSRPRPSYSKAFCASTLPSYGPNSVVDGAPVE